MTLIDWLRRERPISSRKLAQELNLSHSYINDVLKGKKPITWNFAAIVAQKTGLEYLEAFKMAGLLPEGVKEGEG